jgi:hypothetical protein
MALIIGWFSVSTSESISSKPRPWAADVAA